LGLLNINWSRSPHYVRQLTPNRGKSWTSWLVQKFECDRLYPEQELNRIIKPIHPDTATLRQELVGYNMLHRDNSIYQRVPESEWRLDANY
jgi:hypothetical protein